MFCSSREGSDTERGQVVDDTQSLPLESMPVRDNRHYGYACDIQ